MIRRTEEGAYIEVEVRVDAPAEAVWQALSGPAELTRWFPLEARGDVRVGGILEVSWGDDQWWAMEVAEAEAGRHLRLKDATPSPPEGGPTLFVDYHLTAEGGSTVVRLVHSGFGPGADWDEYLEALDAGWGYFMRNLKLYVERHRGVPRRMLWARPSVSGDRAAIWAALLEVFGVEAATLSGAVAGTACALRLEGRAEAGVVETTAAGRALGIRLPDRGESMLFIEVEAAGERGRVGLWLSTYGMDDDRAAALQRALDAAAAELEQGLATGR